MKYTAIKTLLTILATCVIFAQVQAQELNTGLQVGMFSLGDLLESTYNQGLSVGVGGVSRHKNLILFGSGTASFHRIEGLSSRLVVLEGGAGVLTSNIGFGGHAVYYNNTATDQGGIGFGLRACVIHPIHDRLIAVVNAALGAFGDGQYVMANVGMYYKLGK